MPNYFVDPNLRFNLLNRGNQVPNGKLNRYMDTFIASKEKIPSPDKYAPVNRDFLSTTKNMKIYPFDRETYVKKIMKESKKIPGVASYDAVAYDEKYVKPTGRAIVDLKEDRYTKFDEIKFLQRDVPSCYE